jgi:hypothetical protein
MKRISMLFALAGLLLAVVFVPDVTIARPAPLVRSSPVVASPSIVVSSAHSMLVSPQDGCAPLYQDGAWAIERCAYDPAVPNLMTVTVDGGTSSSAALLRIYHKSQTYPGKPQVAVIYASGFVRLKQNADPSPPVPFGSSFVLGPAYWSDVSTYHHNPQITSLNLNTRRLQPNGSLHMQAYATNGAFAITYNITMPPPRDDQTRLRVVQTYTATTNVSIPAIRRTEKQGFKLVQISSMFINESGACAGGFVACHDSDAARYMASNLERHQVAFSSVAPSGFVFTNPLPLSSTWLDALHTDDVSWQGNTPNVRIALDALPNDRTITPQGWISATTDPNDDNVGLWLHDDGTASESWAAGRSAQVSYWLLAQDNPSDPWNDLELRNGATLLNFEGAYQCYPVRDERQSTVAALRRIAGYTDTAIQLDYDLGTGNRNWAQIRCDFNLPIDLSSYDHLRFEWRGDPNAANSMEVGLITRDATGDHIFARGYHHVTHRGWWGHLIIPFQFLEGWTPGRMFNPAQVVAVFISVVKDGANDSGGSGRLAIDNLGAFNVARRPVLSAFERATSNKIAARAAADWIATQQTRTGLVKSWQEEGACVAHTYDQALALIVFVKEKRRAEADALARALVSTQNADGSWYKSRNCETLDPVDSNKWEGDIAWAVYGLSLYLALGGDRPDVCTTMQKDVHQRAETAINRTLADARRAMQKGADYLRTRIGADGCLVIDHTEGTIDAWWAFQFAGPEYQDEANRIRNCLLTYYWDDAMGRFKGGRNWWQPFLDNQTWGAAFLRSIGESAKARRALSYARATLVLPAQGAQAFGFDGQGGPWAIWNEGTGQYIAAGGEGANRFLGELIAQQEPNGALSSSLDEYAGGGVWTTRWHGVAPTAWLYFALQGGPFLLHKIYLPLILKPGCPTLCICPLAPADGFSPGRFARSSQRLSPVPSDRPGRSVKAKAV